MAPEYLDTEISTATDVSRGTCCGIGLSTATDTLGCPAPTWSHPQVTAPLTRVHNGVPACPVQQHRNDGGAPAICQRRWDRADSLARFVLPHPTRRRGLSGLQHAPTCQSGTPSAPLLRSGGIPLKGLWPKDKSTLDKVHLEAPVAVDKVHAAPETAWKAQICLFIEKDPNEKMNISEDILNAVIPLVWASEIPGRAKNATLVKPELKPGAQSVRKKQYPIKPEARKGLNL
ncbi:hypothetical protein QYF61_014747 [Mycteria americana]|uniref:Uncharacterized protein n=1 Tax=Mycteria americana TaxID=33587 RepID=A0AAN7MGM8_MYCAM|nr:hypothetical protein QYF61_014747 [Mycteria americana]